MNGRSCYGGSLLVFLLCVGNGCGLASFREIEPSQVTNQGEEAPPQTSTAVPEESWSEPVSQTLQARSIKPNLREIARPRSAYWLLDPIELAFHRLDAREALRLTLPLQRIEWRLRLPVVETVSYNSVAGEVRKEAMEAIMQQADWTYSIDDHGTVFVSDLEERTLTLLSQPGSVSSNLSVNALASGGGDSAGGLDGASVTYSTNPYEDEVKPLVESLIDRDSAARFRLLPSANAILLTARPSTVRSVADAIHAYNERLARTVRLSITIFEVTTNSQFSIGSRLSAAANRTDANVLGGWNVDVAEPDGQFSVLASEGSGYFGSSILLEWLNSEGDAAINWNDTIEVRNNEIAASSTTRTFQFISSISREQDQLGRERTEVERGETRTGWSVTVHPTIGTDAVTVRLSLARRALVDERPFSFGEVQGVNFVTDDSVRAMTVTLQDGEARIMTALTSSDDRHDRNKLFGLLTGKGRTQFKTESVLLMRAELI